MRDRPARIDNDCQSHRGTRETGPFSLIPQNFLLFCLGMATHYQQEDLVTRGYLGMSADEPSFTAHLKGAVKDNLSDREQRESMVDSLRNLQAETGFSPAGLLVDIQALEEDNIAEQNFRVGEAYAEVILKESFNCKLHWNQLRDARNPKGNRTGADLVGFIEVDSDVLFLFGEVKTSSEIANRPPQVMTSADGIERQLSDLYTDHRKRMILISYLQNKVRSLDSSDPFKVDFQKALKNYYNRYQLIGVLVRDVSVDERDLSVSYERLKTTILSPVGIRLLALYVPIEQPNWLTVINS